MRPRSGGFVNQISRDFMLHQPGIKAPVGVARDERLSRTLDLTVAILALIFFAPLMLLVALAVRASGPGPILFRQARVGRGGVSFGCLKFRTMVVNAEEALELAIASCSVTREEWERDQKLRNDPRTTRIGRILRKLSLDELPQIFNVVAGDMSIVGPRPIVGDEIGRYGPFFEDYCSVKPGITGLWQISGRNDVSYSERVRLDAEYAATKSIRNDLVIIARTVPAVIFARGCY